jgi:hypothetical protein
MPPSLAQPASHAYRPFGSDIARPPDMNLHAQPQVSNGRYENARDGPPTSCVLRPRESNLAEQDVHLRNNGEG